MGFVYAHLFGDKETLEIVADARFFQFVVLHLFESV
jgi:hypothetical protein